MADTGAEVPTYEYMKNVETLRHLPNLKHSKDAIAIRIPIDPDVEGSKMVEVTYQQLHDLVEQTATALVELAGLSVSDVVSIVMPNQIEFVLAFLAVPWTRAVSAPLNQNYTEKEYTFYMEDNKSKCVLVPAGAGVPAAEAAAVSLGIPVYTVGWDRVENAARVVAKTPPAEQSEEKAKPTLAPEKSDVALFLHTSGTTAKPKGVPLTHANLVASMNNISLTYSFTPTDAVLLVMPLFHVHGLMSALLSTLATGGTVIMPPQLKFSAGKFWHNAVSGKATWVTCVPTIYQVLLLRYDSDYPKDSPPEFRFVRSCSSALAPAILTEIEEKFKAPCVEAYAMTEASHQMCSNPVAGPRKAGTVGKGTGVAVAILDGDNNVVTEPDTEGEVCIRGRNVTAGYIGVSDAVNEEAFAGGWFHTGDQGRIDADGYLTLTGRIKELINRGGEKISPLEVDAAMLEHPAVAEAVSFAKPHGTYGEVVAAALVLKEGQALEEAGLQEFLKDKLTAFKIPTEVYFDEKLPKTATGKIQRRIVAAHFLRES